MHEQLRPDKILSPSTAPNSPQSDSILSPSSGPNVILDAINRTRTTQITRVQSGIGSQTRPGFDVAPASNTPSEPREGRTEPSDQSDRSTTTEFVGPDAPSAADAGGPKDPPNTPPPDISGPFEIPEGHDSNAARRILRAHGIPGDAGYEPAAVDNIKARCDAKIAGVRTVVERYPESKPTEVTPRNPTSETIARKIVTETPRPGETKEEIYVYPNVTSSVYDYLAYRVIYHEPPLGEPIRTFRIREGDVEIAVTEYNGIKSPLIEVESRRKGRFPATMVGKIGGAPGGIAPSEAPPRPPIRDFDSPI